MNDTWEIHSLSWQINNPTLLQVLLLVHVPLGFFTSFQPQNPWKHEGFKSFMRYGWTNCYKDFLATWVPTNLKNPLFKDWGNVGSHKSQKTMCFFLNASKSDTFPPISFGSFCFRHFAVPKSPTFVVVVFEITRDFFWCATSRPGFVILFKRFPKSTFLSTRKTCIKNQRYQRGPGCKTRVNRSFKTMKIRPEKNEKTYMPKHSMYVAFTYFP